MNFFRQGLSRIWTSLGGTPRSLTAPNTYASLSFFSRAAPSLLSTVSSFSSACMTSNLDSTNFCRDRHAKLHNERNKPLRSLTKMYTYNDGKRTLLEACVSTEVRDTLEDWASAVEETHCWALIGGLAVSHYGKPRATLDIDLLYANDELIPPAVPGFSRTGNHAFRHNRTLVVVEIVTPTKIGLAPALSNKIITTSIESDGVKVASPAGLIASKLYRLNARDKADIIELIKAAEFNINLDAYPIVEDKRRRAEELFEEAQCDPM